MSYKNWDAFHEAFRAAIDKHKIKGIVWGGCEEPWIFYIYDADHDDVLWAFSRSRGLRRFKETEIAS